MKFFLYKQKMLLMLIIVDHVPATVFFFFSKVHPACHNIVNGIKTGSDSKKTEKHAVDCSKDVCWDVK